jgi:hypothetical protein
MIVDVSAATNIPGAAVQFRWDFESDGTLDTGWNAHPFERPVYLGDGQDVTDTVLARNRARERATDTVTFTLVDCIPG